MIQGYSPALEQVNNMASTGMANFGLTAREATEQAHAPGQVKDFGISAIIAAAIAAAASIGVGVWQAKKQNEYNKQMVDEQNEYNSPKNQMERYREAGLNPYLAASQGGVSAGTQEQPVEKNTFDPKHLQIDQIIPLLSLVSQMQVNRANIAKIYADASLRQEQINTEVEKQNFYRSNVRKNDKWTDGIAPAQIGLYTSQKELNDINIQYAPLKKINEIYLMQADAALKREMITRIAHQNKVDDAKAALMYQQVAESQAKVKKIAQEIANLQEELKLTTEKVQTEKQKKLLVEKDIEYRQAQKDYTNQMESYFGTQEQWIPFHETTGAINALMPF